MTAADDSGILHADDDSSISDDDWLYRWVPAFEPSMIARDSVTGDVIGPTSGAFQPDTNGTSVYLESVLLENDLSAQDATHAETDSVWAISVSELRSIREVDGSGRTYGLGLRRDAFPQDVDDPEHPRYVAHALITGLLEMPKKPRIRAQRGLARATSLKCILFPGDTQR